MAKKAKKPPKGGATDMAYTKETYEKVFGPGSFEVRFVNFYEDAKPVNYHKLTLKVAEAEAEEQKRKEAEITKFLGNVADLSVTWTTKREKELRSFLADNLNSVKTTLKTNGKYDFRFSDGYAVRLTPKADGTVSLNELAKSSYGDAMFGKVKKASLKPPANRKMSSKPYIPSEANWDKHPELASPAMIVGKLVCEISALLMSRVGATLRPIGLALLEPFKKPEFRNDKKTDIQVRNDADKPSK